MHDRSLHDRTLVLEMLPQPNNTTCGPTCLHAVYRYYGEEIELDQVIREIVPLSTGGTLAVELGNHARSRGYRATILTCNLQLFDPTWFSGKQDLRERLEAQAAIKDDPKLREATRAHLQFIDSGGMLRFGLLGLDELHSYLGRGVPLLTGLSATYMYGDPREHLDKPDSIRGEPVGHFVVVSGSDPERRRVRIADPLEDKPNRSHFYWVETDRLMASILLGILTYDASMLIIERQEL